jgi:protein-tyrosine-phosphatase
MGAGGRISPVEASRAAGLRGIEMTGSISQDFTPDLVAWADLIVVMEMRHKEEAMERLGGAAERIVLLGDLDPERPWYRSIPDPIERPPDFYDRSFARIDRCIEVLMELIEDNG